MFVWTSGFQNSLVHTDFNMFVDEWMSVNVFTVVSWYCYLRHTVCNNTDMSLTLFLVNASASECVQVFWGNLIGHGKCRGGLTEATRSSPNLH